MAVEGLSARLYLDHNVHPWLARDLRVRGFDVTFAAEVGNERATDEMHLRWAAEHGRAILTFDADDYPALALRWYEEGRDHWGIILSIPPPRITYGEFLRRLLAFLDQVTADELFNRVRWLNPVE